MDDKNYQQISKKINELRSKLAFTEKQRDELLAATPKWIDEELINEVEQVALALDALFSYERGLDPYIDALNAVVRKAKGDSE